MASGRRLRPTTLGAALMAVSFALPAGADWLVLHEGGKLETRGAWEVKGKLVVFTSASGALSSMRLADIDLEASREATAAAERAREQPPPPPAARPEPSRAKIVLTDADVRRAVPEAAPAAADAAAAAEGAAPATAERLVVTDWQESTLTDGEGLRLTGTVRNTSEVAVGRVRVTALLYDAEGALIATGEAQVSAGNLMPGRQARFQVDFPAVFTMSAVRFETAGLALDVGTPAGAEAAAEEQPLEPEAGQSR